MTRVGAAEVAAAWAVAATGHGETRQAHYLRTVDNCALVMFRLDLDGCITDANRNADAAGDPQICVSDNGGGLAPDELRLIFEEFGQVAAHRADNPSGLGLGLPVSRKFATAMGGTLVADSTVGVGSRFCLTLPRTPPIPR